jgi:predicted extracellular nuclease
MRNFIKLGSVLLLAACGDGSGTLSAVQLATSARGNLTIADIQSPAAASPYAGEVVSVSGVVTGDFQNNDKDTASNLGGFFMQQQTADGDARTSDGIFVYDGPNPRVDVRVGDRVVVRGTVQEHFGETQIVKPTIGISGTGTITVTDVTLPASGSVTNSDGDPIADLEHLEGMLVRFPQALTVTNLRDLERFGAVSLSQGGRLYQFTNSKDPDIAGYRSHKDSNARRSIELDDGDRAENPRMTRFLEAGSAPDYSIRAGDSVTGITGNLRFSRGSGGNGDEAWRLMPTVEPSFDSVNPRPGRPVVDGTIVVASFNVLNFFTTVDSGANACGPRKNDSCRGADSRAEFRRQLDKTSAALALMDADIVGLMELENNASESLAMIVDALNRRIGSDAYGFVNTGAIHDDAIKTGFIYKAATVMPFGEPVFLDERTDPRFNDARNRPALAQAFRSVRGGAVLSIVVNHLKSKGSSCEAEGDRNIGDGQGNCNLTRTNAAAAIADWVSGDPTGSGDSDYLVIGDLNAYTREDPLRALTSSGLKSLLAGNGDQPYSFIYDKQAGALDHALATESLVSQVSGVLEWHINADEPPLLDYNLEHGRDPSLFEGNSPYRASDHDPVIVGLRLTN